MGMSNEDSATCNPSQILAPDVSPICEQHRNSLGIIMSRDHEQFLQMRPVREDMTSML